jgi:hypothetical protein
MLHGVSAEATQRMTALRLVAITGKSATGTFDAFVRSFAFRRSSSLTHSSATPRGIAL